MSTSSPDSSAVSEVSDPIEIAPVKKAASHQPFLAQRPGYLASEGTLQIKTRAAQRHFLSLLTFAKQIKVIYRAARQDDPYADARLIQIEHVIEKTQCFLQEKMNFYQPYMPVSSSLSLSLADTQKPLCLPIRFTTPYGHIAARVLVEFDTLARRVISLYHWGLLADMPLHPLLQQFNRPLNQLWETTQNWQPTGLTRAALMASLTPDQEAMLSITDLDPLVLHKARRAKYAPPIFVVKPLRQPTESRKSIE